MDGVLWWLIEFLSGLRGTAQIVPPGAVVRWNALGVAVLDEDRDGSISCPGGQRIATRDRVLPLSERRLPDRLDFAKEAGLHVENKAAHRDVFFDPRVRPHPLDLRARVLLGILVREEVHGCR